MTKKNIKITCFLAVILFICFRLFKLELSDSVSYAVSAAAVFDIIYDRFLWRFNPLEKTPRIYGKYDEICYSSYNGGYEYSAKAKIHQNLSSITVLEEVEGSGYAESITATLKKSSTDGYWILYYTYLTHPAISPTDEQHEGTAIMRVTDNGDLVGTYFTNRLTQTRGDMKMIKARK